MDGLQGLMVQTETMGPKVFIIGKLHLLPLALHISVFLILTNLPKTTFCRDIILAALAALFLHKCISYN